VPRPRLAICLVAIALAGCSSGHRTSAPKRSGQIRINVSASGCGTGWAKPSAGQQTFLLSNTDVNSADVLLTDARTGAVYADVEPIGPGATALLRIDLGSGAYTFKCAIEDTDIVVGPVITIDAGVKSKVAPVLPVSQTDMIGPTKQYEAYVRRQLPGLRALVVTLRDDVRRGELAAARRDWLPAHLAYERLGAAYGAFGDADTEINGRPDGLPGGVHDREFTGFHRIEYGLWHGERAAALTPVADALARAVGGLEAAFPKAQIDPTDVAIRAHEITENALQFELTGHTDFGSGSNLPTARANLDGTREVLALLRPILASRYPAMPQVDSALDRAQRDLDARHGAAGWTPLARRDQRARERIDADFSELSELLAPVASICEPRRTS
jgi:iron uptake system component EfeO